MKQQIDIVKLTQLDDLREFEFVAYVQMPQLTAALPSPAGIAYTIASSALYLGVLATNPQYLSH